MRLTPALAMIVWAGVAAAPVVLAGAALADVAMEGVEDPGPGYPPKMGEISGTLGGKPVAWETYDFSIGAFDASAWAESDWNSHVVSAHLIGYMPGKPQANRMRLRVDGTFGAVLHPGKAEAPVTVALVRGADFDGPRLSSEGQSAEFVIDSIGPKVPDSYSRHVTGHVTARLCPVNWPFRNCQDIRVSFETDMQVDSALPIRR